MPGSPSLLIKSTYTIFCMYLYISENIKTCFSRNTKNGLVVFSASHKYGHYFITSSFSNFPRDTPKKILNLKINSAFVQISFIMLSPQHLSEIKQFTLGKNGQSLFIQHWVHFRFSAFLFLFSPHFSPYSDGPVLTGLQSGRHRQFSRKAALSQMSVLPGPYLPLPYSARPSSFFPRSALILLNFTGPPTNGFIRRQPIFWVI